MVSKLCIKKVDGSGHSAWAICITLRCESSWKCNAPLNLSASEKAEVHHIWNISAFKTTWGGSISHHQPCMVYICYWLALWGMNMVFPYTLVRDSLDWHQCYTFLHFPLINFRKEWQHCSTDQSMIAVHHLVCPLIDLLTSWFLSYKTRVAKSSLLKWTVIKSCTSQTVTMIINARAVILQY